MNSKLRLLGTPALAVALAGSLLWVGIAYHDAVTVRGTISAGAVSEQQYASDEAADLQDQLAEAEDAGVQHLTDLENARVAEQARLAAEAEAARVAAEAEAARVAAEQAAAAQAAADAAARAKSTPAPKKGWSTNNLDGGDAGKQEVAQNCGAAGASTMPDGTIVCAG